MTEQAVHAPASLAQRVRGDFPILAQEQDGKRLVYLDSAATGQKPSSVIDAIDSFYRNSNAPIHRSTYALAESSTQLFEGARERIAAFMGATTETTIFTRNATEAINLVAHAWGRDPRTGNIGEGDVVLVTEMEHHSNIVPWQMLCRDTGATLDYVKITDDGLLDADDLAAKLAGGNVKLFAVAHISNVLGTVNDVKALVAQARAAGATVLIDGSQAVPQMPVNVAEIDADFYVWTGHKAYGPTGIGVLHGRRELLATMRPWLGGGDMIKVVNWNDSSYNDLPWKFEAGTSAVAEAVGLGAAIDFIAELGSENIRAHEHALVENALPRLAEIPGLTVVGPGAEARGGVISFTLDGMHPHDVGELLGRENVCVRTGHHCAQPLMRRLGIPATARASFACFNDTDDVDALIEALHKARKVFGL
ncbi:MAG: SufS family cysteine desulfurase [Actinobacteria bacterium]|nr:SufS family cysteine desulfurase [Actinomycetota bacterium]